LYLDCQKLGIEVLLDDRPLRPGVIFSDMELIGIPHRVVLSERGLKSEQFEYKGRRDNESQDLPLYELTDFLTKLFNPSSQST
jgi:prolyl-tRNA synthetase